MRADPIAHLLLCNADTTLYRCAGTGRTNSLREVSGACFRPRLWTALCLSLTYKGNPTHNTLFGHMQLCLCCCTGLKTLTLFSNRPFCLSSFPSPFLSLLYVHPLMQCEGQLLMLMGSRHTACHIERKHITHSPASPCPARLALKERGAAPTGPTAALRRACTPQQSPTAQCALSAHCCNDPLPKLCMGALSKHQYNVSLPKHTRHSCLGSAKRPSLPNHSGPCLGCTPEPSVPSLATNFICHQAPPLIPVLALTLKLEPSSSSDTPQTE